MKSDESGSISAERESDFERNVADAFPMSSPPSGRPVQRRAIGDCMFERRLGPG
ncbi:hypothetical protein NJ7G_4274 [Natrinema sp. J7-2]|nr:hypothetical protein NJ7G_4274 [Natrinema sp. J7-2]